MSSLKEQNGKYYQQCPVVMLATDETKSKQLAIQKTYTDDKLVIVRDIVKKQYLEYFVGQHLYILSDEEIEVGSYVVSTYDKWKGTGSLKPQLGKVVSIHDDYYLIDSFNGDTDNKWDKGHSKKIIATTDEELRINSTIRNTDELSMDYGKVLFIIPRPSQKFIKAYIEQYNTGTPISSVLVEYERDYTLLKTVQTKTPHPYVNEDRKMMKVLIENGNVIDGYFLVYNNANTSGGNVSPTGYFALQEKWMLPTGKTQGSYCSNHGHNVVSYWTEKLKVDQDNTITITKLKESYSREDLDKFLYEVLNLGMSLRQNQLSGSDGRSGNQVLEDWKNKNL